MATVFITGADGFAGHHLVDLLVQNQDDQLYGTSFADPQFLGQAYLENFTEVVQLDIRDRGAVHQTISTIKPDVIFHLAAQTFVPAAFKDPWSTLETNMRGTLNLLDAIRESELQATRMINVSSSVVYGLVESHDLPLTERQPFNPGDPYAVSKIGQEMLGRQYVRSYDLQVVTARAFNHTGSGQSTEFVIPNFAMQIARIEQGLEPPVLKVGNLSAQRDFLDVRDVVRAYNMLVRQGESGAIYNICSGYSYSIRDLVDRLIYLSGVEITIEVDEARLRPVDLPRVVGDNTALRRATGWKPLHTIDEMLALVLNDCRQRLADELKQ
jgi:GDP-4-dehydro-6-deoxy-D-mannose reductase